MAADPGQISTNAAILIAVAGGVGVFAGGVLQAFTGWFQDRRTAKREHNQWLRDQRFLVYSDVIRSITLLAGYLNADVPTRDEAQKAFSQAWAQGLMISDLATRKKLTKLGSQVAAIVRETDVTDPSGRAKRAYDIVWQIRDLMAPLVINPTATRSRVPAASE